MKSSGIKWLLGAAVLLGFLPVRAADIDLFLASTTSATDAPNVLFVLDNAANFSASVSTQRCSITAGGVVKTDGTGTAPTNLDGTAGAVEQCALYSVISALSTAGGVKVNIGVMGFNANGMKDFNPLDNTFSSNCPGGVGGCLLMPIVPMNAVTKPRILEWIRLWAISGNSNYNMKGNNTASGAGMQEAWAYLAGKTGLSGRDYSSVAPSGGCAGKNVIFIGNAYRNNATPGDATGDAGPKNALFGTNTTTGMNANPVSTAAQKALINDTLSTYCGAATLETSENKGVYALNWARYMKAQGIISYSIGILGPTCNAEYAAHLTKLGSTEVGGGKYFGTTDFQTLVIALNTILSEIQTVNSVFAAVSLPVSVNTQGSYLNQVYVGMFRPAQNGFPRWYGNLKQYKLGYVSGNLRLVDADANSAINNLTGFITACARSYWTPSTTDTYWDLVPDSDCLTEPNAKVSNFPDGNIVEKGGQAYKLRAMTPASRVVKTCSPVFASCTSLTDFATSNSAITQALLNSGGSDRDSLINWARGTNVDDELDKTTAVMRPTSHGDVVHSRPVPVNHGTENSPSIVVYYGANDGMLRAVNGNQTSSLTSNSVTYGPGEEMWSFMPPEFYGNIKRLRDNTTAIAFPGTAVPGALPKAYGIDGPITSFTGTVGGSTKTYVYATMRRGGRAIYAFDVTTPAAPSLLWRKGCPNAANDTDCSTDFTGIGQTWSSLISMYATAYGSGTSPLLIAGGGYDECEDYDAGSSGGKNHNCTYSWPASTTPKGNKIFILDATSGAVVRSFDTARSVVADVLVVPDANGKAKYAYTADLGGNVYRLSLSGNTTATWSITRIAALGCDVPASCTSSTSNRKFMFQPSVISVDADTYGLLLGSGDREKPINNYVASRSVTNYFFYLKDKPTNSTWLTDENVGSSCGVDALCLGSLTPITSGTPTATDLSTKKGWYLALAGTEQIVTSAVTVFGVVSFSTHQPAVVVEGSCGSNLGTTNVYNVGYKDAASANGTASRFEHLSGDGLPPSPVVGIVKVTGQDGVSQESKPFCIGCSPSSSLENKEPTGMSSYSQSKVRLYWYIQK